jgi:hypothetical protein
VPTGASANVVTGLHGHDEAKLLVRSTDRHARQFNGCVLTALRTHTPAKLAHVTLARLPMAYVPPRLLSFTAICEFVRAPMKTTAMRIRIQLVV